MGDRLDAALANAAARGTLAGLHQAIKERLAVVAARYPRLEKEPTDADPSPAGTVPTIYDGWLPPKTDKNAQQFPMLLVRPRNGVDSEQSAEQTALASVEIVIGTYGDEVDGWLDVLLLIDAIRDDFNAQPAIQGTGFEQVGPMAWEIPAEQPRPQWFGTITTNWQIPRARRIDARNPMEG